MRKNKKGAMLGLLAVVALSSTVGLAYAYWAGGFAGRNTPGKGEIEIGEGEVVATKLSLEDLAHNAGGKKLVPHTLTTIDTATETQSYVFTANVIWSVADDVLNKAVNEGTLAQLTSTLTYTLGEVTIGAEGATTDVKGLFNITHTLDTAATDTTTIKGDKTAVALVITVTMNEPDNVVEYNLIKNQKVTFNFTLAVAAVNS